jgi:sigma-E factor negative regulatory protein RseC
MEGLYYFPQIKAPPLTQSRRFQCIANSFFVNKILNRDHKIQGINMKHEEGFVASNSEDGWAQVITTRGNMCGSCRAAHCCSSLGSTSKMAIRALNTAGAKAGDLVTLSLKTDAVIKSAAIAYLIPVVGLIGGAIAGVGLSQELGANETTISVLLALVGLVLGFAVTIIISRWMSARGGLTPVITGIMRTGIQSPELFMAIDPVCKMEVDPAQAPASLVYKDKTYYFCHAGCKDSFLKDPRRYL